MCLLDKLLAIGSWLLALSRKSTLLG